MDDQKRIRDLPASKAGARAREQLIEAAGEVFAEKGFHGATSREICERAGVNSASVNYHFGGFEALYISTLTEAHRRAVWVRPEDIEGFVEMSPRERLSSILRNLVGRLLPSEEKSWHMRLVSQELFLPTFAQGKFITKSVQPRREFFKSVISAVVGRPPEDPMVSRCMMTVIAPCIMMSLMNRQTLETMVPEFGQPGEIELIVNHIVRFVMAGLDAVIKDHPAPSFTD